MENSFKLTQLTHSAFSIIAIQLNYILSFCFIIWFLKFHFSLYYQYTGRAACSNHIIY